MSTPHDALNQLRAPDQNHQGRALSPEVGEVTAERLAAIEKFAVTIRAWNPTLIPGPLQTTRYAAGAISNARPSLPGEEVQRYAHHRAARVDQFLERWGNHPAPEAAWFVVGEQAITRPLTHRNAHRAQLRQLLSIADHPKVNIRVLPAARPAPGRSGQMSLYGLEPTAHDRDKGARLGYLESPVGAWYTLRAADVARLHTVFAGIIEAALDDAATRTLITEVLAA